MLLASYALVITGGVVLILHLILRRVHRSVPFKGLALPLAITLIVVGLGILIFSVSRF